MASTAWIAVGLLSAGLSRAGEPTTTELPSLEYRVKAAFLYNFSKFVDWPVEAFGSPTNSIVIGTLGENPFGHALAAIVEGNAIEKHKFQVKSFRRLEDVTECHVLFINGVTGEQLEQALRSLQSRPILTVGEDAHFLEMGGVVQFTKEDNKVRFEINATAAERARLKLSARLLSLARAVVRTPATEKK